MPSLGRGDTVTKVTGRGQEAHAEINWLSQPELRSPVIIAAFEGWNDAGDAASAAVRHLTTAWNAQLFASVDPEGFFDFTTVRPNVALSPAGERHLLWPTNEFFACSIPDADRDAILITGVEPQLRWRTFSELVLAVARRYDAELFVTLGALLADVPHTRPTIVYGSSNHQPTADRYDLQPSSYEGPTGIVGVLNSSFASFGFDSASLWAAVPTYVPGATSPKAAMALLERLRGILDAPIDLSSLENDTVDYERQLDSLVADDDDTASYLAELERQYDAGANERTNPEDLVREVEEFLRDQRD